MDNNERPGSNSGETGTHRGRQLTITFTAPTITVGGILGGQAGQVTPPEIIALALLWLVGVPSIHMIQSRFALRRKGIKKAGRLISRIRLKQRPNQSPSCNHVDSSIRSDRAIRNEALNVIGDTKQPPERRRRAVHDLVHGRGVDETTIRVLHDTIQDRYLPEGYRHALAVDFSSCDAEAAMESLDLFSRDSSNSCCTRFSIALHIADETLKRRAVLSIAKASEADEHCRFEAALVLLQMDTTYAEYAFQSIATDTGNVSYQVRIAAAVEWSALDRDAAIDALWQVALGKGVPWPWRIAAAARLVLLRVRAAYELLQDGLTNPDLPAEVRKQIRFTLAALDARHAF